MYAHVWIFGGSFYGTQLQTIAKTLNFAFSECFVLSPSLFFLSRFPLSLTLSPLSQLEQRVYFGWICSTHSFHAPPPPQPDVQIWMWLWGNIYFKSRSHLQHQLLNTGLDVAKVKIEEHNLFLTNVPAYWSSL